MESIKIIKTENSWLEGEALMQLKKLSELEGAIQTVGLPDLHPGRGFPAGAALVTKDIIYPSVIGNDIGCGMTLFQINCSPAQTKINRWIKKLDKRKPLSQMEWDRNHALFTGFTLPENPSLGTIGSGNHFAEFLKADEIFENSVEPDALFLLIHSGSRGLGSAILDSYLMNHKPHEGLIPDSTEGKEYLRQHNYALKWAECSRRAAALRLLTYLGISQEIQVITDLEHNSITPRGKYWVHRKGAAPGDRGSVMIPGSRGSKSYLVEPLQEAEFSAWSLAHGAGRKWNRRSCKEKLFNRFSWKDLKTTPFKSRVICEDINLYYEEAPQAYKNIECVIKDMEAYELICKKASFIPLITYKV